MVSRALREELSSPYGDWYDEFEPALVGAWVGTDIDGDAFDYFEQDWGLAYKLDEDDALVTSGGDPVYQDMRYHAEMIDGHYYAMSHYILYL
jgi:hypothetical protein